MADTLVITAVRSTLALTLGAVPVAGAIADDSVTYAKMQNVSATDRLLGRATAGAGDPEEIVCTPAARALLDDADATAQRATLGLGAVSLLSRITRQFHLFNGSAAIWTNMPASTTEVFSLTTRRLYADLTGCTMARLVAHVSVAGFAGSKITCQYSLDDGVTWFFMDGSADGDMGAETPQVSLTGTGPLVSAYMALAGAAAAPVLLRAVGDDGNGVVDPQFTIIALEVY